MEILALREKINELRAKQRWHSLQEMEHAREIQSHIHEQSRIEDNIIELELEIHNLRSQKGQKPWQKLAKIFK